MRVSSSSRSSAPRRTREREYEAELDETYVAFSGGTAMDSVGDYIRIDGPSVWIEFSMQNGIVLSGAHPHAVWRDKQNDYGGLTS